MSFENLEILHIRGHKLHASLDLPLSGPIRACAILAHCFTCSANLNALRRISKALGREGIAVMRLDFTGLGKSTGSFEDSNFSGNVEDLYLAAAYLTEHYEAPKILIGHSLGGTAVLQAAHKIDSIDAVVTIGSPAEPMHVSKLLSDSMQDLEEEGVAEVSIAGRQFRIKQQFVDDLRAQSVMVGLKKLNKALLIMHSPDDEIVEVDQARLIYEHASHPKSFISLEGADHLMTNPADAEYVGGMASSWVKRYIDWPKEEAISTDKQVVTRIGKDHYATEVQAGHHSFLADEPKSLGGTDRGMSPYELIAAGLGSCTAITLRMYADRKGWPVDAIEVHLSHVREHATDGKHPDDLQAWISVFEREIRLEGSLTEEQTNRMMEIADRCPVHRTMEGKIEVRTRIRT